MGIAQVISNSMPRWRSSGPSKMGFPWSHRMGVDYPSPPILMGGPDLLNRREKRDDVYPSIPDLAPAWWDHSPVQLWQVDPIGGGLACPHCSRFVHARYRAVGRCAGNWNPRIWGGGQKDVSGLRSVHFAAPGIKSFNNQLKGLSHFPTTRENIPTQIGAHSHDKRLRIC
jgi:hypothetical protein